VSTCDEQALVAPGKAQVEALFRRQADPHTLLDDRDFVPLLKAALTAFDTIGLSAAGVDALWDHAFTASDRLCREADPSFTADENRELMRRYLVGPRRAAPGKTRKRRP
jgi:hypothetical protein